MAPSRAHGLKWVYGGGVSSRCVFCQRPGGFLPKGDAALEFTCGRVQPWSAAARRPLARFAKAGHTFPASGPSERGGACPAGVLTFPGVGILK